MNPTTDCEIKTNPCISKNQRTRKLKLFFLISAFLLLVSVITSAQILRGKAIRRENQSQATPSPNLPYHVLKTSCRRTRYPTLCLWTMFSIPEAKNAITQKQIIEIGINRTVQSVTDSHSKISKLISSRQDLDSRAKAALSDCLEMLDQTIDELQKTEQGLKNFPAKGSVLRQAGDLKTLLSAAMTNQNSCIDEFSGDEKNALRRYLRNHLVPISRMVSNSLAMVKNVADEEMYGRNAVDGKISRLQGDGLFHLESRETGDGFPLWVSGGDRMLLARNEIRPDLVVAGDGSGDFPTICQAVEKAPNFSSARFIIRIKAGTYRENVEIPRHKTNIMLVGEGRDRTVITGSQNVADGSTTFKSATLGVAGDGFMARDLTIINTAGLSKRQAVALRVNANLAAFYRCNITAYQDTLYAHSLRQFYRDCNIHGTVDFIFGNAAVVFQNSLILAGKPNPGQKNMITAQGRDDPNQNTGISIQNCTLTASPDLATVKHDFPTYLGRPWRNHSRTVVMQSFLDDVIHPQGWHMWNEFTNVSSVEYGEYANRGPGSNIGLRVKWAGFRAHLSREEAREFTVGEFIQGGDWLESSGFRFLLICKQFDNKCLKWVGGCLLSWVF